MSQPADVQEVQKISVKIPLVSGKVDSHEVVNVFHRWIQQKLISEHLVIDVSDYGHVHNGPGTILVCHEAIISFDTIGGTQGLTYFRKTPLNGTLADRIKTITDFATRCAKMLQDDAELGGKLKFDPAKMEIRFHDRLLAPNSPGSFEAIKPAIAAGTKSASLTLTSKPGELLCVTCAR